MTFTCAFFCLALAAVASADTCYNDVSLGCAQASSSLTMPSCNALYGHYSSEGNVHNELQAYANLHLKRSYEYLLSSAYFDNYKTNRQGFHKLFRKLADNTWEKTIDLIKHITQRGGVMDFTRHSTHEVAYRKNSIIELHELESLAQALDTQKEIAERAFHIHREATKNEERVHDAEVAQYLEEEFIEGHAKTIRDLAGHTSDLKQFVVTNNRQELALSLYLFDEYLQKVV